jgi:hypothetical protein
MSGRPCIPRQQNGSTRLGVLLVCLSGLSSACGRVPLCVEGPPDVGETVRVTVIEPWDAESRYPWDERISVGTPAPERADLGPGSTFLIRVDATPDPGQFGLCRVRRGTPQSLDNVEFLGPSAVGSAGGYGAQLVWARQETRIGEQCRGSWSIGVDVRGSGSPFAEPVPGEPPGVVLSRHFIPEDPETCGVSPEDTDWRNLFVARVELVK